MADSLPPYKLLLSVYDSHEWGFEGSYPSTRGYWPEHGGARWSLFRPACRYTNLIHDISDTRTRLSEFPNTCEAALTSVQIAMTRQIAPTINTLYMVLTVST